MINSVRYVDLGEACLARKKHIITYSGAPWNAVLNPAEWWRWVALAQCEMLGETQSKNGHDPKVMPVVFIGGVLQSLCYLKMRNAHFTGESGFAPTELVSNNLYT